MNPILIMLIDDHTVVRAGIRALFEKQSDMKVVAEASKTEGALDTIQTHHPDILVLDLTLPGGGSLELIRALRNLPDSPRVLVLTMHDDPAYTKSALQAGAVGYVVKTIGEKELVEAVRDIVHGRIVIDLDDPAKTAGMYSDFVHKSSSTGLSDRELEVLTLLGRGFTNQEVAEKLDISPKTVATYKSRIAEKLGLRSTSDYVKFAADNGLH